MGLGSSTEQPAETSEGFHLHGVQDNSPAQQAGLEPYFDFIITIGHSRLVRPSSCLPFLLPAQRSAPELSGMDWSFLFREVGLPPTGGWWCRRGRLDVAVRVQHSYTCTLHIVVLIDVEPSSPASLAGLCPYTDYVIGSDQLLQESEDFFTLIESHEGKPLKLMVYNSESDSCREVSVTPNAAWGGEGSLGCGIGYGYLHRIPIQPPSYHKKPPPGALPPGTLPSGTPPPGALPPGTTPLDSPAPPGPEMGSRQGDYLEATPMRPNARPLSFLGNKQLGGGEPLGCQRAVPLPLGFLDVSGISLLDSSASVCPSLPSFPELTSTAVPAAGLEDVGSSSGSHERGGEATWSGSEFEVSFPDSPGAQAQQDHLPQLTLPDSLTSAASPEDGLSAELLEAQAEEEPASTASPGLRAEAEAASQAQLATPEQHPGQ
uniref:Golgi reassembly stacking protein 1 n=1 Tax=Myotis lucifugus TaxID=59463 RepID=G1P560_MYOLU